jgi:hypothetical protein
MIVGDFFCRHIVLWKRIFDIVTDLNFALIFLGISSIIALILIFKSSLLDPLKVRDLLAVYQRITREGH